MLTGLIYFYFDMACIHLSFPMHEIFTRRTAAGVPWNLVFVFTRVIIIVVVVDLGLSN